MLGFIPRSELNHLLICSLFIVITFSSCLGDASENIRNTNLYDIEGVVYPPDYFIGSDNRNRWCSETKIYIKGGQHIGFLKDNGSFVVSKLRPGSYVVEVVSDNYVYEAVRVDINTKGKVRARRITYVSGNQITPLPYPLRMKPLGVARYFHVREQMKLTDFLFNPMILMMVLPLACIMLLPRVMNDPEAKKDMEQFQNMTKYDMPEVSEMLTSLFAGGSTASTEKQSARCIKQGKKSK